MFKLGFKIFPIRFLRFLSFLVTIPYYLTAKKPKILTLRFLEKAAAVLRNEGIPFKPSVFRLFQAFALTILEKVEVWNGKVRFNRIHFQDDDIGDLIQTLEQGKGALLICSHLGNYELLRGLAFFNRTGVSRNIPVTSIVDFSVMPSFTKMLQSMNPASMMHLISANEVGPETVILLQERIAAGGLVVIAGDRTSANTRDKYFLFPFLGEDAPFAVGPFFLAALLNAPTYFVWALRRKDVSLSSEYNMHVHKNPFSFDCSRKERNRRVEELARLFARKLEYYCKQYPHQWYNFYDFWAKPEVSHGNR
jgi:predicted LPLAT superfamily acyltransferase